MFNVYLKLVACFLLLVILPVGVFCMVSAVAQYRQGTATYDWPTTVGQVTSSSVRTEVETMREGRTGSTAPRTNTETNFYHADIVYAYSVAAKKYEGHRVVVDDFATGDQNLAAELVSKYPVGCSVTVYYDPDRPSVAVLEQGTSGSFAALFAFGTAISIAAFGFGWLAWRVAGPLVRPSQPLVLLLPNWVAPLLPSPVKQWIVRYDMRRFGMDPDEKIADSKTKDR